MSCGENNQNIDVARAELFDQWYLLHGYTGDYIFEHIRSVGRFYEEDLLTQLAYLGLDEFEIIDVGANLGNHTIGFAASHSNSPITAIEPLPKNTEVLRRNIIENGYSDRVNVVEAAAGDSNAALQVVNVDPANMGAVAVEPVQTEYVGPIIDQFRLDELKFAGSVGLIKIDVEGFEPNVLRGGLDLIAESRPILVTEAHSPSSYREIASLLAPYCYVPVSIKGKSNNFVWISRGAVLNAAQFDQYIHLISAMERRSVQARVLGALHKIRAELKNSYES